MFSCDIPEESNGHRILPIMRTRPRKPLRVVLLARRWVGVWTHFWNGSKMICRRNGCEACDSNWRPQWEGFIPVSSDMGSELALFAFTPMVTATLDSYRRSETGVLGMRCLFTRAGGRQNSPLQVQPYGWADPQVTFTMSRVEEIVARVHKAKDLAIEDGRIVDPA